MSYNPVGYDFNTFKKLLLADENVTQEYNALEEEFALISEMIRARKRVKKTQKDIAEYMCTSISAISRLESIGGCKQHSPTLDTLKRYAKAVNCQLVIKFEDLK